MLTEQTLWLTKFDKKMLETAILWSELSSAKRLKVGAVLARNKRILATGYNGTVPGTDNCCEEETKTGLITKKNVIHAEENIIIQCARQGISAQHATLYCTHCPCSHCSALLASLPIRAVYYLDTYRDAEETFKIFEEKRIPWYKVNL